VEQQEARAGQGEYEPPGVARQPVRLAPLTAPAQPRARRTKRTPRSRQQGTHPRMIVTQGRRAVAVHFGELLRLHPRLHRTRRMESPTARPVTGTAAAGKAPLRPARASSAAGQGGVGVRVLRSGLRVTMENRRGMK
jgi:hypothetical protein